MNKLFIIIIILVLLFFIAKAILKSPKFKGIKGENKVKKKLGNSISNQKYVLNDIIIKEGENTSQIDHVVINKFGIFVIETKNYAGQIYGNDYDQEWTQVLQYGKVKNKFYSPVKQNLTHINRIKSIVNMDNVPIKSIVVFVQGNINHINSKYVYKLKDIKNIIEKPIENGCILTTSDINKINNLLKNNINSSNVTLKEHVKNIKTKYKN